MKGRTIRQTELPTTLPEPVVIVSELPVLSTKGVSPYLGNPFLQASVNTRFLKNRTGLYVDSRGVPLNGTYKVTVTPQGQVRYGPDTFLHTEIVGGKQALTAGEIVFENGKPLHADIHSGHFQAPVGQGYDLLLDKALRLVGYDGPVVSDSFKK
jgi:hypothetical protein